ncbi:MAG: ParB/RepB/Spo0J family partition protein, partial [Deltaproteobacteria bacterium]|nr:ParB/RepB/Spo0J family partition protein [Deltaproteobacteria bacterium]
MSHLIAQAIDQVGLGKLTEACGLASTNSLRKGKTTGKIPLDNAADYPGIIERETRYQITREMIWSSQAADLKADTVYPIPLGCLAADPRQPRVQFEPVKLQALAADIQASGVQTPIRFRLATPADRIDTALVIVHGERRWRASRLARRDAIPALLDTTGDSAADRILRQATDNDLQEHLTPWDWVLTIRGLHEEEGWTMKRISEELTGRGLSGFSRPAVSNLYRLYQLPAGARDLVKDGWLSAAAGKYLLSIKHPPVLETVVAKLVEEVQQEEAQPPTIARIQSLIADAYLELAIRMDNGWACVDTGWEKIEFDPMAECKECPSLHRVDVRGTKPAHCVDAACFREKQASARQEKEAAQAQETEACDGSPSGPSSQNPPQKSAWERSSELRQARIRTLKEHMADAG